MRYVNHFSAFNLFSRYNLDSEGINFHPTLVGREFETLKHLPFDALGLFKKNINFLPMDDYFIFYSTQ